MLDEQYTDLYIMLCEAQDRIDTYKYPDIREAQEKLNEVLKAAGLESTGNDKITSILFYKEEVEINTRYSVHCCGQRASYTLPMSIVNARDPIKAATLWGLTRKRDEAAGRVAWDQQTLDKAKEALDKAQAALDTYLTTTAQETTDV